MLVDWKEHLRQYSKEDILDFLKSCDAEKVKDQFEENSVDGKLLLDALEDESLFKEITSTNLIRWKIRNNIEDYVLSRVN